MNQVKYAPLLGHDLHALHDVVGDLGVEVLARGGAVGGGLGGHGDPIAGAVGGRGARVAAGRGVGDEGPTDHVSSGGGGGGGVHSGGGRAVQRELREKVRRNLEGDESRVRS